MGINEAISHTHFIRKKKGKQIIVIVNKKCPKMLLFAYSKNTKVMLF